MSDRLHALLNDEADTRLAGAQVPSVAVVYARRRLPQSPQRRRWGLLAPVAVAVAVLAVAAGAQLLASPTQEPNRPAVVVPPAPDLGAVVPPQKVREKLGARGGHSAGPAVPSADALAVSQPGEGGVLRTVGVVRPLAVPDGQGQPRVDRCVSTYSDPDLGTLHGSCRWGGPAQAEPEPRPVTVQLLGPAGRTWVSGTAPAGTAAVVLRSPGLEQVVVATADPGPRWAHRPFYVAWWPRAGTDIIAVDAAGKEIGRGRLPSDQPSRTGDSDPQLGTIETPLDMVARIGPVHRTSQSAPPVRGAAPARMDVLALVRLDATTTLFTLGHVDRTSRCINTYVQDLSGDGERSGGGGSCGLSRPEAGQSPISVSRSFSAGTGKPEEQLLEGSAPAGTVTLRLVATGITEKEVPAFDGGARWEGRAFFLAPWPSGPTTRLSALGADGQVLATTVVRGLNLRAFDDDFLAAQASCMERAGAVVIRHPQPDSGPAYEFKHGTVDPANMRRVTEDCEDAAEAATAR